MSRSHEDDEYTERVFYADPQHPRVAESATKMLRAALTRAQPDAVSIADFWDVFSSFTQKYQYGQFLDTLVDDMKSELRAAIHKEYYSQLRIEARDALKDDVRKEEGDDIFSEVYDTLRSEIEVEIGDKLRLEVEQELRQALEANLLAELRPLVEAQLKAELMGNPDFVEEARKEIQRRILGLQ